MTTGTVKWFNEQKGYGFIQPDQGGKDVFVHISAVERSGMRGLAEGQKVSYDVEADRRIVLGFIEPCQRSQEQPFRPEDDPVPDNALAVRSPPSHARSMSLRPLPRVRP